MDRPRCTRPDVFSHFLRKCAWEGRRPRSGQGPSAPPNSCHSTRYALSVGPSMISNALKGEAVLSAQVRRGAAPRRRQGQAAAKAAVLRSPDSATPRTRQSVRRSNHSDLLLSEKELRDAWPRRAKRGRGQVGATIADTAGLPFLSSGADRHGWLSCVPCIRPGALNLFDACPDPF